MTRKEFIEKSTLMGFGFPFISSVLLNACGKEHLIFPKFQTDFSGKVIIVGAGAAGLAAGYVLKKQGVDFEIIEAAAMYGGRIKKIDNFVDFPLDVGAEWIHTDPKIFADIMGDTNVNANIDTMVYNPQSIQTYKNGRLKSHNYLKGFYSEWKFKNTTWFDFFEQYIVPEISDKIVLSKPVTLVDYSTQKVILKTANNDEYQADKVLITVPIKVLQKQLIEFEPPLPKPKIEAINHVYVGDGIKIFIEFKERFYPDILSFGNIFSALKKEEKFVYDAAFKKSTDKPILGLFAINEQAAVYTKLNTEEAIIKKFLGELDEIFDGKASENYVKHIIQNWSSEPYIQGAYSYSFKENQYDVVEKLKEPVAAKIYFAGEALSIENQATVHGACESAYSTVAAMMQDK